ncbi:MAG: radical SAM protein [Bacteroidales bacterium]|nr:radical SAM protein [Bacteroidales bacterium]
MELIYYMRQWPGSRTALLLRFFNMGIYELRRIFSGRKYIAEFDLSSDCNLRCKHCYHFRTIKESPSPMLPLEKWREKFLELRLKGIRRILLIGGEPAVRMDVIKEACRIFKYVDICTNGTIPIGSFYTQKLFVSIDGTRETHDNMRGPGVFDKVLENYNNDSRVVLSMTLTNDNWMELEFVLKLAVKKNFLGVSCDLYTPHPDHSDNDPNLLHNELRGKIIDNILMLKKKYPRHLLMSNSAIKWFYKADHSGKPCYWRDQVLHFNEKLEERPSCANLDCRHCGHFAQANLSPLNILLKSH